MSETERLREVETDTKREAERERQSEREGYRVTTKAAGREYAPFSPHHSGE